MHTVRRRTTTTEMGNDDEDMKLVDEPLFFVTFLKRPPAPGGLAFLVARYL
jgi:hypothetical protein